MQLIRRAIVAAAASAMAALVVVTATACGTTTTTGTQPATNGPATNGPATNGLESKTAAEVLNKAAAALASAKSVHVVGTSQGDRVDARLQGRSSTGMMVHAGAQVEFTMIGNDFYIKTDQAGLKSLGMPAELQRQYAGRWLKITPQDFTGLTLADLASQLTAYRGPLEPKVQQAALHGTKAVIVSWQDGGKLYVANTGPAYPLHGELTGQDAGVMDFTEYNVPVVITAPANAIDLSNAP